MKSPRTSNITNNDEEHSEHPVLDERTPLLKKPVTRFNDNIPCVSEIDEEAAEELVDKAGLGQETRNIGGVISILLIGLSTVSLFPMCFLLSREE
jgi:hypothetical protein